jgi:EAL domain-containing protein (putative c-di-GMP-specific phosphodiesterase class I)/PAS domain-containing protein
MLYQSQNDAEAIISLFRNTGHAIRAKKLNSVEELAETLTEQDWDILIGDGQHPELSIEQALSTIESSSQYSILPSLLVLPESASDEDIIESYALGVSDVVRANNPAQLIHSALRDIKHRRSGLEYQQLSTQFNEVKDRYELLLEGSQDAIAYITDGMHIHANDAYSSLFHYQDSDDFDCLPVIDLIADSDQDAFKAFLKRYSGESDKQQHLDITAVKESGEEFSLNMQFSDAVYEGEDCTQILIRKTAANDSNDSGEPQQSNSSNALIQCSSFIDKSQQAHANNAIGYIRINFDSTLANIGFVAGQSLFQQFFDFVLAQGFNAELYNQFDLIVFAEKSANALQDQLQQLAENSEQHVFEVDGKTINLSFNCGIAAIDHKTDSDSQKLVDTVFSAAFEAHNEDAISKIFVAAAVVVDLKSQDLNLDTFVDNQGISISYQPVVSLRGDTGEYYEALYQCSDDFQQTAERFFANGESKLDRWIIMESSKALCAQRDTNNTDTRLFINLSATVLKDNEFCNWLGLILKAANIPPQALVFQLPAAAASEAVTATQALYDGLKKHQLRFSLAQFSHFQTVLKHIKADFVRLDENTAESLTDDDERQRLKELIRELAGSDIATIVPEVNIASMLTTLWQIGVGYIQGDYLQGADSEMNYEFTDLA